MSRDRTNPAKFPATAVPLVLEQMRKLGALPGRVRAKIAGGASMFSNFSSSKAGAASTSGSETSPLCAKPSRRGESRSSPRTRAATTGAACTSI